jgi:hypothetical protein
MPIHALPGMVATLCLTGVVASFPGPLHAQEVVEVQVSPQVLALQVGGRERLFFSAFDGRGNLADAPVFQLTTSDAGVARVDSDGTVTGMATGRATLVVRSGSGSATVDVIVGPVPGASTVAGGVQSVDRIVVSPPPTPEPVPLMVGSTFAVDVRLLGPDSLLPPPVTWSVSDSQVARFDAGSKTLHATAPGLTVLTARVAGLAELQWRFSVAAAALSLPDVVAVSLGASPDFEATVVGNAGGAPFPAGRRRWSSDDPAVISIDDSGVARALDLGRATVTAMAGEARASTTVYVVADMVVSLQGRDRRGRGLYQVDLASGTLTPLLVDSASNLYAARSPSRDALAFASDREGLFHLYTMRPDGTGGARLTTSSGHQTQPAWSPDGQSLVYTATSSGTAQLFEVRLDGTNPHQRTFGDVPSHSPAVSNDGRSVAFTRGTGAADRVYLMDREGGNVRPVSLAEAGRFERTPRFFPNGDLAAVIQIGTRASAIVRWDRLRDRRVSLVTSDGTIQSYAVSRDGRTLVAVVESSPHDPAGKAELLVVDLPTRQARSLVLDVPPGTHLSHPSF